MKTTINRILGTLGLEEEKLCDMRSRYQVLCCQAADLNTEVEYTERHPQRKRKRSVDNWLKSFKELQAKVRRIEHDIQEGTSTSCGYTRSRNQLAKITREIEELMEQKKSLGELTLCKPASSSLPLVTTKLEGHMFQEGLRRILSWLKNDRISKIGVYGVGGVGKTALLMQAHNDILETFNNLNQGELFFKKQRHVYWVTVLQECTVFRLQQKIATAVGLNHLLTEDDEKRRAAILSEGLKDVKGIVLFLDDLWEHFSLEEIGIPVGAKNIKYIISARNAEVVQRMECQQILKLEPLVKEEAWKLFKEKLGSYGKLSVEAKIIARKVAEECGGLPLGIKIMATSMTEVDDIHTWRDVLADLRSSSRGFPDMEIKVLQVLRVSYDYLKDVKLQQCFLSCALFPEDYQISRDELIILMLSMGLLEGMRKRQEQIDKGHAMLNKLEHMCLLESITDANQVQYVKMHDLVRDMAIRIAMDGHQCLIEARAELRKALDEEEWKEELKKVSLMSNCISEIPSTISPKCPQLSILLLQDNPLNKISDSFFNHLKNLQYLNLSHTNMERLPNSISGLQNLTALLLSHCWRLRHIPSLALLMKLRELDLSYCESLNDLPTGMDGLVNLKSLKLNGIKDGFSLQGRLPRIPSIQFLKLDYNVKGVMGEDLLQLEHLEGLEGWCMPHVSSFNQYVKSQHHQKLHYYDLVVGSDQFIHLFHEFESEKVNILERNLRIYNTEIGGTMEAIVLPLNMQYLQIQQCDFSSETLLDALPSLIKYCPKIKSLSSFSLNHLQKLEELIIEECVELEELIPSSLASEIENDAKNKEDVTTNKESIQGKISISVPNLKVLKLLYLPKLGAGAMKTTIHRIFGTLGQEEERLNNMRSRYQLLCSQAEYINTEVEYTELHPQRKRKRVVDNWMKCFKELQAKVHHVEHGLQEGTSTSSGHMTSRNQVVKLLEKLKSLWNRRNPLVNLHSASQQIQVCH
ncbi:hypothetical protein RDABS01_032422 [Bienertia sinuspersici]